MGGYGGWMGGMVTMLLFWAILILAIVLLWRLAMRQQPQETRPTEKGAMQILEERYARGEIGQEEFLQKRRDLGQGNRIL